MISGDNEILIFCNYGEVVVAEMEEKAEFDEKWNVSNMESSGLFSDRLRFAGMQKV